jgi:hypothetical protein
MNEGSFLLLAILLILLSVENLLLCESCSRLRIFLPHKGFLELCRLGMSLFSNSVACRDNVSRYLRLIFV